MIVNLGLSDDTRANVAQLLNQALPDEFVLYVKTRRFHWNVEGRHFGELLKFFEAQYEAVDGYLDAVAERVVRHRSSGPPARCTTTSGWHGWRNPATRPPIHMA